MIEKTALQDGWDLYTVTNKKGMRLEVLNFGGIITSLEVPDKDGNLENIVLGYRNLQDYQDNPNYFGALIGQVAGRIQESKFELDNETFQLEANEGKHHLHGGPEGFHQVLWEVEPFEENETNGLRLYHTSKDGEGGYPGNLTVNVTYTLSEDNKLAILYKATTDKATPVTLTNHTYFNLSGGLKRTVATQQALVASDQYTELDEELISTGRLLDTAASPFDLRSFKPLQEVFSTPHNQLRIAGAGIDHYFLFTNNEKPKAGLYDPESGRLMTIESNQPGLVLYTGNGLDNSLELKERKSEKHLGICFETQAFPAALHHDGFPDLILKPGEEYRKETIFSFTTK
ncbi:aldose epimerase family protein [Terribacillus saccharophilus]|uniref:Aldose 1-epimerase n=1 Tax=Terribacillus saccharophilus TaxID=361277 RepID=A0A268ADV4_9BACI|nr:aldose epimerase family protein [Terribacillus saccharophilus]PAD22299.1 galactose-1-epimerase [Terribacillus saccharophilus]